MICKIFTGRHEADAKARFNHRFVTARDRLHDELRALFAEHAAKGALQSGATVKRTVRLVEETTAAALSQCLELISSNTDHSGRKRRALLSALSDEFTLHWVTAQMDAVDTLNKIGLRDAVQHAIPLFQNAHDDQAHRFRDYRDGWTAPRSKAWHERHPILYGAVAAICGAVFAKSLEWIATLF